MKIAKVRTLIQTLQTGQFWYIFPHYYYSWRRSLDIEHTAPVHTAVYGTPGVLEVCVMTGTKHHVDLLYAVKSFVLHYELPISLVIHADSSITAQAIARMQRHLPQAKILTRTERDRDVIPELERRGLNQCLKFRNLSVFATRWIDAFLLSKAERIFFLDTDCLIFRSLDYLRQRLDSPALPNLFDQDVQPHPYPLSAEVLSTLFQVEVKEYLNAGFCLINRSAIDLELMEAWLSIPQFPIDQYLSDQGILAGLVSRENVELFPEDTYNMGRTRDETTCTMIHYFGHYLGQTRTVMRSVGQLLVISQLMAKQRTGLGS